MGKIQSIHLLQTKKIIRKIDETEKFIFEKIKAADTGDLNYYHTVCNQLDGKIGRNMSELRSLRPIKGARASFNRLLYVMEKKDLEFRKIIESLLIEDGEDEEKKERVITLNAEFESCLKEFLMKNFRQIKKDVDSIDDINWAI